MAKFHRENCRLGPQGESMAKFYQRKEDKGEQETQTPIVEIESPTEPNGGAKAPTEAMNTGDIDSERDGEKSGGRPPLDATKRERGTSTPSDASSGEGSSTSEES